MARKFLIIIGILILIAVTARVVWEQYQPKLMALAFVPSAAFEETVTPAQPDYGDDASWAALPHSDNGAKQLPEGVDSLAPLDVDIFYLHPTTYLKKERWNGPIDDVDAAGMVDTQMLPGQASVFNTAGHIYAPRYRQATLGAFMAGDGNSLKAFVVAYSDVLAAFDAFIANHNDGRPFILAGHSQGALHALNLLRDRIATSDLKDRMIAAYLIGWPVSIQADLAPLGLSPCDEAAETGCIVSWQSFADGGDPAQVLTAFNAVPGVTGLPRLGTDMLCINPLSWQRNGETVPANANPGAVAFPRENGALGGIKDELTGARCGPDGILYIDPAPGDPFDGFLLPGKNYHVYDYSLFYMSLWTNARVRAEAFLAP